MITVLTAQRGGKDYMNQILGEIKLLPYDDVPVGFLRCSGQALRINKYPKLYMLIGTKFGKEGDYKFKLPDLTDVTPKDLMYCIVTEGKVPKIHGESENSVFVLREKNMQCKKIK